MSYQVLKRESEFLRPAFLTTLLLCLAAAVVVFILTESYFPIRVPIAEIDSVIAAFTTTILPYYGIFIAVLITKKPARHGYAFYNQLPVSNSSLIVQKFLPGLVLLIASSLIWYTLLISALKSTILIYLVSLLSMVYIQTLVLSHFVKDRIALFLASLFIQLIIYGGSFLSFSYISYYLRPGNTLDLSLGIYLPYISLLTGFLVYLETHRPYVSK